MSNIEQALKSAIEALENKIEYNYHGNPLEEVDKEAALAIEQGRAALGISNNAIEKGEPVYQVLHSPRHEWQEVSKQDYESYGNHGEEGKKRIIYTLPQPREWVGLSEEQLLRYSASPFTTYHCVKDAEAKLKQLNMKG